MKRKIIRLTICTTLILFAIMGSYFFLKQEEIHQNSNGSQILEWNETSQLIDQAIEKEDFTKLIALRDKVTEYQNEAEKRNRLEQVNVMPWAMVAAFGLCLTYIFVLLTYINHSILIPFEKMKTYAEKIASGDFDVQLNYERSNYFGDFTWAFDSMRREITKARAMEKEAVENNKVVIATLSHDIKTPISSIRVYAEGLEANFDSPEDRQLYLQVIMDKCDEVAKLTNDLFLHSITDLNKLRMDLEETDFACLIRRNVEELNIGKNDIIYKEEHLAPEEVILIKADSKRILQVMENIINNARKYAQAPIEVTLIKEKQKVFLKIKDHGSGIPDEDMPFILEKFYRGRNVEDKPGSGLGLYIAQYIMHQCKGEISLHNQKDGLEVTLELPILS